MILQRRIDRRPRMRRRRDRRLLLLLLLRNLLRNIRRRRRLSQSRAQGIHILKQYIDLVLQRSHVASHVLVLLRVLEAIAAVGRVDALEVQVAAALARRLPVALDLAPLALVARQRDVSRAARLTASSGALRAIVVGFALGAVRVVWAVVVVLRVGMLLLLLVELLRCVLLLLVLLLLVLAELVVGMRGDLGEAMRRIHGCRPCALSLSGGSCEGAEIPQQRNEWPRGLGGDALGFARLLMETYSHARLLLKHVGNAGIRPL
jgi:hypothetical protein